MTTIVDPLGTPSVTYNRFGTAIVTVSGAATSGSIASTGVGNDANPIPRVCQTTIAMVTTSSGPTHNILVRLPDDAEVGDVVEVYRNIGSTESPMVFPNVGEAISLHPASTGTNNAASTIVNDNSGLVFRKVSSTLWMPIGAAA